METIEALAGEVRLLASPTPRRITTRRARRSAAARGRSRTCTTPCRRCRTALRASSARRPTATSVAVELIADGVHIHPSVVRAVFTLFGGRVILISDSMMATGLEDGEYSLGGQAVTVRGNLATLHDGTIAGSATNLMDCVRSAVRMGIPLGQAVQAASTNPARALVHRARLRISRGRKARKRGFCSTTS